MQITQPDVVQEMLTKLQEVDLLEVFLDAYVQDELARVVDVLDHAEVDHRAICAIVGRLRSHE